MIVKILIIISTIIYIAINFNIINNSSYPNIQSKMKYLILYFVFPFYLWYKILTNIIFRKFKFKRQIIEYLSAFIVILLFFSFRSLGGVLIILGIKNPILYFSIPILLWWLSPSLFFINIIIHKN